MSVSGSRSSRDARRARLRTGRRIASICAVALTTTIASVVTAIPAVAVSQYTIAWTGIGIYPRSGPSMDSAKVATALPDGATVSIACELEGQAVSNGYNVSTVWERLSDGTHLPNAFIDSGVDGWTPGIPRCDAAPTPAPEQAQTFTGTPIHSGKWLSYELWDRYLWGKGAQVVIAWDYVKASGTLVNWMQQLPVGQQAVYHSAAWTDGDLYWALGAFTVTRTSEHCYSVADQYDFYPDKPTNLPLAVYDLYRLGGAQSYQVRASGCL